MTGLDRTRVLLVDDHPIVRAGLRYVLEVGGIAVVGEAETVRDAVRLAERLAPDVVVMDLSLPDGSGLEATREIKRGNRAVRVLVVSVHGDDEHALGLLEAGADGFLLKQAHPDELRAAVHRVRAGERVLAPSVVRALVARATGQIPAPGEALTEREREVLRLLADGATSKEIALTLGLKPKTVENHRARILDKLGVTNSAAAVRIAVARGLLPAPALSGARYAAA